MLLSLIHIFQYFLQIHECPKTDRSKVKIKKWLDTPNLKTYEKYIADWHFFLKDLQEYVMKLALDVYKRQVMPGSVDIKQFKRLSIQATFEAKYEKNSVFFNNKGV